MKAIKIDRFGVTEVEADDADILSPDITWTCLRLEGHNEIWADDEAFQKPGLALVNIGSHPRVPLPAYICGYSGERSTDTTLSVDEVRAMISFDGID